MPPNPAEAAGLADLISTVESAIRQRAVNEDQAERIVQVLDMTLCGFTQTEISDASTVP